MKQFCVNVDEDFFYKVKTTLPMRGQIPEYIKQSLRLLVDNPERALEILDVNPDIKETVRRMKK